MEHIELRTPYTTDRLQAAIERVARILGQDLTQNNVMHRMHHVVPQTHWTLIQ
jgi:hypothetical protein